MKANETGNQAIIGATLWGPVSCLQSQDGSSPKYVVGEGAYIGNFGAKLKDDASQAQYQQNKLIVEFKIEN